MERRFEKRKAEILAECETSRELFKGVEQRLREFATPFASTLQSVVREEFVRQYLAGLSSNMKRKNIESIAYFHDQDRLGLQRFIGQTDWDHRPMLSELARQVGVELGEADAVIVFDPSGHSKQGNASVGVKRQWNGRHGKIENCQLGIYMGYVSRLEHVLVNERLFLPKEWANDKKRRRTCHVPSDVKFATRLELSLDMLQEHGALLPHGWIAADDEFGRSTTFRRALRDRKERYLLAVPCNTLIRDLEAEPPPYLGHGKRPKSPFQRVDRWRAQLAEDAWTRVDVRDGEKGPIVIEVAKCRVLAITEKKQPQSEEVIVITRRLSDDGQMTYDYYLSSADPTTSSEEFARVATAQHRVEECIKRAKSEAGLSQYETRTWWGWHHHQTLSMLATWFLIQEVRRGKKIDTGTDRFSSPPCLGENPVRCNWAARQRSCRSRLSASTGAKRTGPFLSPQTT